jgi:hypothetical protein
MVQKDSYLSNAVEGLDVVTLKVLRKRSQLQVIQAYSSPRVLIMKSSENFLLQSKCFPFFVCCDRPGESDVRGVLLAPLFRIPVIMSGVLSR